MNLAPFRVGFSEGGGFCKWRVWGGEILRAECRDTQVGRRKWLGWPDFRVLGGGMGFRVWVGGGRNRRFWWRVLVGGGRGRGDESIGGGGARNGGRRR